jgi:GT2 family glycosyltransferase
MKIDFVIPHLNYEGLKTTLKSLREKTPPENINQIILIDQNKERFDYSEWVDIHIIIPNQGFARAANLGIRLSDTEYVAVWNDDCEAIHPKWIQGIEETFKRYDTALCVNVGSPRNPRASGDIPVNHPGFDYKENFSEEEYDRMVNEIGKGVIYDGITMFAPIFHREKLEQIKGVIPGKCWFDEYFHSGGEDYDMNRRAYLSGFRCLGTTLAYAWHWWYSTSNEKGEQKVKYDGGLFHNKWGEFDENGQLKEVPDIYGKVGKKEVPQNKIRD